MQGNHFQVAPDNKHGAAERKPPILPFHIEIIDEFRSEGRRFVARFVAHVSVRLRPPAHKESLRCSWPNFNLQVVASNLRSRQTAGPERLVLNKKP